MEWVSVQAALTTTTEVMEIMETADMVIILMVIIHTVTILIAHTIPMAVDMVTILMVMEWLVWDGVEMAMETDGTEITTMEIYGEVVQQETEKLPMSLITIEDPPA
jgi:hypothetical protein